MALIDIAEDLAEQAKSVERRMDGHDVDEIPGTGKDVDEVMAHADDLVEIEDTLR